MDIRNILSVDDTRTLCDALRKASRVSKDHADMMDTLADRGGNPIITESAARAYAAQHRQNADEFDALRFRVESADTIILGTL